MSLLFAYFFGVAVAIFIVAALIYAVFLLIGIVLGFVFQAILFILAVIAGIVGLVIVWHLSKKLWKEIKEFRRYLKKNKEIKNRMKAKAMQK